MVIPLFKEDYENKTIEELVMVQKKLIKEILDFENEYILKTREKKIIEEYRTPSSTVVWRGNLISLETINKLLDEKTRDEDGIGIDFH